MRRWKNPVWVALGLSALLAVAGVVTTGPALAQAVRAVLMRDVDNPALQPIRFSAVLGIEPGENFKLQDVIVVPAGKRLVLENVSIELIVLGDAQIARVQLREKDAGFPLFLEPMPTESRFFGFSYNRLVKSYYNPGETLQAFVQRVGSNLSGIGVFMFFTGHLVTL